MTRPNRIITFSEFEEIPLLEIENKIGKRGVQLINKLNRFHKVEFFRLFYNRIKATQFVGFVKILNYTIQVLPKMLGEDKSRNTHFLLQLLRYTKKIDIKEQELGQISELKDNFFEVFIFLFAKNLRALLRNDFKKSYVEFEDNLPFLKGKLLVREQVKQNSVNYSTFCCRFEQFTENNLMNQLFKYVASILIRVSDSMATKKLLEDILIYLCDVEYVVLSSADIDRINFTRLNCEYKPLVDLCRLFLENMSPQFSSSKLDTFIFMFDMNKLFEEFVFEFIKRNRSKIFIDNEQIVYVKDQAPLGKLFDEFRMKVDILIQCGSGRKFLLDTKYKLLGEEKSHGGLSQADFYQMYAYSVSQREKYKEIILLYPESAGISFVSEKNFLHQCDFIESSKVYVRTINLTSIFNCEKNKLDEEEMISELNKAFQIDLCCIS